MAEGEFALMHQHLDGALQESPADAPGGREDAYAMLVDAAAQQRHEADLQKYLPLAEEYASRIDHKFYMAIAHRSWGVAHTLVGEYAKAEERLQKALEIFSAYPAPWQIGRTQFEMGELARVQGNTSRARDHFSRALGVFDELHAAPYAARTREALDGLSRG